VRGNIKSFEKPFTHAEVIALADRTLERFGGDRNKAGRYARSMEDRYESAKWAQVVEVLVTSGRRHATMLQTASPDGVSNFWNIYEEELVKSVAKEPHRYALEADEPPEVYARRIRQSFERTARAVGLGMLILDSNTFKRTARRVGVKKFSQAALKQAYASVGGKT
jgi:hypothetical protein